MKAPTRLSEGHNRLQFLVFGAGALGTYIGGSLALAGYPVIFLERPQVADKLNRRGLYLELFGEKKHFQSPIVVSSIQEALSLGSFFAAIFTLKSYDTAAALEIIRPYHKNIPPILCLQNGVGNEAAIEAVLSVEKVIAGTVTSAIGKRTTGEIVLERFRGMGVAANHPISSNLAHALDEAGLNASLFTRAADMKWSKLLTNLLSNSSSAILDMSPAEIFSHPKLAKLEIEQLRETLEVMNAQGINTIDLPSTPVRSLAFIVRYLPIAISQTLLKRAVGSGRGGKMPSFYLDLHSGRGRSEVIYLNGVVVRCGERLGIPTPVNRLLTETLMKLTKKELPLDTFAHKPEKLLQELHQ